MGVTATETNYVITLPRLMGYKTLVVNAIIMVFGLASLIWPSIHTPDPQALDILFTQGAGAAVAVVALVNALLRLQTTGPAGPLKPAQPLEEKNAVAAVVRGDGKVLKLTRDDGGSSGGLVGSGEPLTPVKVQNIAQSLAAHLASVQLSDDLSTWPLVNGVEHDDQCALRLNMPCSCFANYPTRTEIEPAVSVGDALDSDRFANPATIALEETWRENAPLTGEIVSMKKNSAIRAFMAAFLLPSFLFFGALSIATMPGCASIEQVSAVAQAESVEQRAFALYGTFVVIEERAADMIADKRIPKATRQAVQRLDKIAKPAADLVLDLTRQLQSLRQRLDAAQGASTAGQVALVAGQLDRALNSFAPKLQALVRAVDAGKQAV